MQQDIGDVVLRRLNGNALNPLCHASILVNMETAASANVFMQAQT
jgi:hypothetical protein